ncbi:SusD/RagB family nutrient-binding outer membrane lipoprotein [Reichenbachiella ulvae]|nr:SusD/RagB family nutrient-binding outer membrane lipoprotein [Reichenbachiella ulvae]
MFSDAIYQGDLTKWTLFANSLRLRLAMRISGVERCIG